MKTTQCRFKLGDHVTVTEDTVGLGLLKPRSASFALVRPKCPGTVSVIKPHILGKGWWVEVKLDNGIRVGGYERHFKSKIR